MTFGTFSSNAATEPKPKTVSIEKQLTPVILSCRNSYLVEDAVVSVGSSQLLARMEISAALESSVSRLLCSAATSKGLEPEQLSY